jgi:hypothetical protein
MARAGGGQVRRGRSWITSGASQRGAVRGCARVKPRAAAVLRACGGRRSEVGHVATSAWLPHDKEIRL